MNKMAKRTATLITIVLVMLLGTSLYAEKGVARAGAGAPRPEPSFCVTGLITSRATGGGPMSS